jgi:hypothetical protein
MEIKLTEQQKREVIQIPDYLTDEERAEYCKALSVLIAGGGRVLRNVDGRIIGYLPNHGDLS